MEDGGYINSEIDIDEILMSSESFSTDNRSSKRDSGGSLTKSKNVSFAPYKSTSVDGRLFSEEVESEEKSVHSYYTEGHSISADVKENSVTSVQQIVGYYGSTGDHNKLTKKSSKSSITPMFDPDAPTERKVLKKRISESSSTASLSGSGFGGGNIKEQQTKRNLQWNEKFQSVIDALPDEFNINNIDKNRGFFIELLRLTKDFVHLAELYGKIIISEKELPDEYKTIQPIDVGGIAGGSKYMRRGIMFKFPQTENYGLYSGSDEWMSKVASHELKGLLSFRNTNVGELHYPLMALIDYRGYRLVAMTLLPINKSTLVYGSSDGGKIVHKNDLKASNLVEKACKIMNLKEHKAGILRPKTVYGPADMEVHLGTDGKYYAIDFSRALPPEYTGSKKPGANLVYRLRPEFVRKYPIPLSSDAFSGMGTHDAHIHNTEIKEATKYLRTTAITEFTRKFEKYLENDSANYLRGMANLQSSLKSNVYKKAHSILISEMHREGINLRYMGKIRKATKNKELKRVILVEMIARVLKNTLKKRWRDLMKKNPESEEESYKHVTAKFLNLALGNSNESSIYWQFHVKPEIMSKFEDGIEKKETHIDGLVRDIELLKLIFMRILNMCNISLTPSLQERISRDPSWLKQSEPIRAIDIVSIESKIKTLNTIPLVEGLLLLDSAKGLNTNDKKWILKASNQKLKEAIRVVPGGRVENLAYAKVLYKRAKLDILELGKAIRFLEMAQHSLEYLIESWKDDNEALYLYCKVLYILGELQNNVTYIRESIINYEEYMSTGDPRAYYRCSKAYFLLYHFDSKDQKHLEKAFSLAKRAISSNHKHPGINAHYATLLSLLSSDESISYAECDTAFSIAHTLNKDDQSLLLKWGAFNLKRAVKLNNFDLLLIACNKFREGTRRNLNLDYYHHYCTIINKLESYLEEKKDIPKQTLNTINNFIIRFKNIKNRCIMKANLPHDMIIDSSRLKIIRQLGKGSMAYVFRGELDKGDEKIPVVLKMLKQSTASAFDYETFDNDISTLYLLDHPNIVKLIGKSYENGNEIMVQSVCAHGPAIMYLNRNYENIVPWRIIVTIALGVSRALEYIHGLGIIHNYITSFNILIDKGEKEEEIVPRIANFIFAIVTSKQRLNDLSRDVSLAIRYFPPEKLSRGENSFKTDVYMFGILLWELGYCLKVQAFDNISEKRMKDLIIRGARPTIPDYWPSIYKEIIEKCLSQEKDARPTMSEVRTKLEELLEKEELPDRAYVQPSSSTHLKKSFKDSLKSSEQSGYQFTSSRTSIQYE